VLSRVSQLVALSFLALIAAGTLLLLVPAAAARARPLTPVEALFTATSAVCVTGLIVVDTGKDLSPFGQAVVLALIQCGGLGLMTFGSFLLVSLRGREDLRTRIYVEQVHGALPNVTPATLLRRILLFTAAAEGLGALVLWARLGFREGSWGLRVAWEAVFHAVSAFCNAGFSLWTDSLVGFRGDPVVNLVVMALIVTGGLGFLVLADLQALLTAPRARRRIWRLSLHTKLVLVTSGILLAAGSLAFLLLEWGNTLREAPPLARVLDPLFFAVTCRTAGFNTVPTEMLTGPTLILAILLMAIGASPGSTGGGMKTTTAAVLFAGAFSRMRGRPRVEAFGRSLPVDVVSKAIATVAAFVILVLLGGFALQVSEIGLVPHQQASAHFIDHLFEIVSALGTVGLSTGITAGLSSAGKLVLVVLMFVGRLGPLAIGSSLIGQRRALPYRYPEERILVG